LSAFGAQNPALRQVFSHCGKRVGFWNEGETPFERKFQHTAMFVKTNFLAEADIERLNSPNSGCNRLLWLCFAQRRRGRKNIPKLSTRICG
jgi:hypothetical protein